MQYLSAILVFLALSSMAFAQDGNESAYNSGQHRVALVIGIGAYENVSALPNPPNDARDVATALRQLGFQVTEIIDPTNADLRVAQADFVDALIDADVAMLYFAGHSIQIRGSNFLIPVDASLVKADDVPQQTLELSRIVNRMDRLAKTKIVILDACRDNPFLEHLGGVASGHELDRGLAPISSIVDDSDLEATEFDTYGTVVSYAAAPGKTASDGNDKNSPFTTALLDHIDEPGLEIGRLFRQIAADVIRQTGGRQKPEYLVKLTNEFYFRNPQPGACDMLAAEPMNNLSIKGVEFDAIDTGKAIPACQTAVEDDPENPRLLHNLARSLDAARQYAESIPYYEQAAERGYVHAINNLGVMHINGLGVKQDFDRGTELLQKARNLGHLQARVNMQGTDFSVLMKAAEFKAIQQKLIASGHLDGTADGVFGPASKKALADYQQANRLAQKGVSLETLAHMELVSIIPPFSLQ